MNDRNGSDLPEEDRPFGSAADLDCDLSLVHADDEYLDLLGGVNLDDPEGVPDDQLSALLMSWRRDVEAEPIDELIDQKLATMTVHAAKVRRRRRPRILVPLAAAAAVLAIAFAGVGLMARAAVPGDTLWALTKVLYSDHARSVEAADQVRADLQEAEAALIEGRVAEAKSKLEEAQAALPTVSSEEGKQDLEERHRSLMAQLPGNPSGEASQPPAPNPTTAPGQGSGSDPGTDPGTGTDPGSGDPTDEPTAPEDTSTPPDDTSTPPDDTSTPPTDTSRSETETAEAPAEPAQEPAGVNGGGEPATAE
jgi:Anti-sigma-D factor RsdA to sigma factor binding region